MAMATTNCGAVFSAISQNPPDLKRWMSLGIGPSGFGFRKDISSGKRVARILNAGKKTYGIEPDLPEKFGAENLKTTGEDMITMDTFSYGYIDGHHTFHKKDAEVDVWEAIKEVFVSAGGPTGGQAVLAWGTLPSLYLMMAFGIQVEYIFLVIVLFIFAFIGIEMNKPDLDHEFPPEVYKERRKSQVTKG